MGEDVKGSFSPFLVVLPVLLLVIGTTGGAILISAASAQPPGPPPQRGAKTLTLERPRQALPYIRTAGETFEVWLRGEGISSSSDFNVTLSGKGGDYRPRIQNISESAGRWQLVAELADDMISDLYDIKVRVDNLERLQEHAVSVIHGYEDDFKFIQLTDAHIDDKNSVANLRKAVGEINLINPAFVIFTGDNIDADPTGSGTSDQEQTDILMEIMRGFTVPTYVISGNHEYSYRNSDAIEIYENTINPVLNYGFNYGDHHFIAMDSGHWHKTVGGAPHWDNKVESFTDEQMEWLTADLEEHRNDSMRLMFEHAPLKTTSGKQTPMWHVDDVENLMKEYDVKAFISGHTHRDEIIDANDIKLEGDWSEPNYPVFIQTESGGAEDTIEECNYRVFKIRNETFEYYTYDDDGDGKRSAYSSTPLGRLDLEIRRARGWGHDSSVITISNQQNEDLLKASVILNLTSPPEGMDYWIDDGTIANTINTPYGKIVRAEVSVPKRSQRTFRVLQKDITPPEIAWIRSRVGKDMSGVYEGGSAVEITVGERRGEPDLFGTIDIRDESGRVVDVDIPLIGEGNGNYTYTWDTSGAVPWRNYSIRAELTDGAGNFDIGAGADGTWYNVTLVDTTPPVIRRLTPYSSGRIDEDIYSAGSHIEFEIEEENLEDGLTGNATIYLKEGVSPNESFRRTISLTDKGGGFYSCEWNTAGAPLGKYLAEFRLSDEWGNTVNGTSDAPYLEIELVDTAPPEIYSVTTHTLVNGERTEGPEYPLGKTIHFTVEEKNSETGLTGKITVTRADEHAIVAELELFSLQGKPGIYVSEWQTHGREIGTYYVNATLTDTSGNVDSDGAPSSPDSSFALFDTRKPEVRGTLPRNGAEDVDIFTDIMVEFSEPMILATLSIGVELTDEFSNDVPFRVKWYPENYTALFLPQQFLAYESAYTLRLSTFVRDNADNPLSEEVLITFTTESYVPKKHLNTSFTVYPQQKKMKLPKGVGQNFSIHFLDNETKQIPLEYRWYLNDVETYEGVNASSYALNTTNLSLHNSYELKVLVIGEGVAVSYYWVLGIVGMEGEPALNKTNGTSYSYPAVKWALYLGIGAVIMGLILAPLYLLIRRRRHKNMITEEMEHFVLSDEEDGGDVEMLALGEEDAGVRRDDMRSGDGE